MKIVPLLLLIIGLPLSSYQLYGQADTLNQTINGMKQGYWIVYGKDKPEKGYPENGKIEEGRYVDNRKQGIWIKYHPDGVTPRLKGHYVNGRPNGHYVKIDENGTIREEGTYSQKKMTGSFKIWNEQGILTQEKTFNESGKEEGTSKYYYDDGSLQMEITKKDGVPTGPATTYWENGDIKKVITYGEDGEIVSKEEKEMVNPSQETEDSAGSGGPSGTSGIIKDGKSFNRDGYNKLYNKNDEIWMDGEFKNGKLWNGELYKYDSDGILLKIEIWKNGKYHSDGHL